MTSTLPPDPYLALGVPKDAPAATIKATYRKLVLKCHPDKVTDESLKKQKQEEFHLIQQAYELIGDEEKRATYDAEVRLEQLRKEKLSRSGPHVDVKTARYDVRTAAPGGASFSANGPHRYEKRETPPRSYDDDRYRKYDAYEAYPSKQSSSRSARPDKEPIRTAKHSSDRARSDHKKTRDRDERRERSSKFVHVDDESSSSTDEKARYEADYRRRSEADRRQREEEEIKKHAAESRRRAEEARRSYEEKEPRRHSGDDRDDRTYDRQRKLSSLENDAVRYIHRSKVEADRPSPSRTSSSRDVRPESYDRLARRERPEAVRRSSARSAKERPQPSARDIVRDRTMPEIVEWEEDRKVPSFQHSSSSPAEIHVPRAPQRSFTESARDPRRADTSPPTPLMRRSDTMPAPHSSSSRRKEATVPVRPSGLRSSEFVSPREQEPAFSTIPPPQTTKYYYHSPEGGVSLRSEDVGVANGHRAILREPDRKRSPSPLRSRPPMGANRPVEKARPAPTRTVSAAIPPPPLGRASTFNASSFRGEERGRSRPLFNEVPSKHSERENARRQTSFSPDSIQYAKAYGPEDVNWSGGRHADREYARPSLGRTTTSVY